MALWGPAAGRCCWLHWIHSTCPRAPAGCLFPFFGDFLALAGAIGFTPLDFILPPLLWTWVNKPALPLKAFNYTIAAAYSVVGVLAAVGAGAAAQRPAVASATGYACAHAVGRL